MNRAEVINQLKSLEPELRAHGVAALYLFGSYARGDAGPDSDVDELMGSYHRCAAHCRVSRSTSVRAKASPSTSRTRSSETPSAYSDAGKQESTDRPHML
jgi:nucleotidyltransferase-like protein